MNIGHKDDHVFSPAICGDGASLVPSRDDADFLDCFDFPMHDEPCDFVGAPDKVLVDEVVYECLSHDDVLFTGSDADSVEADNCSVDDGVAQFCDDTEIFMPSHRYLVFKATPERQYLVLDCGAGANLAGEYTSADFENEFQSEMKEAIAYEESHQEFSGISREPIVANFEAWAPTFLGGIGKSWY